MSSAAAAGLAVERSIRINASRERIFALLTDVAEIPRWMPVTTLEPRVGGRVEFVKDEVRAQGEVTEFDPPRTVAYTWDWVHQPLGASTEVRFELEEDGDATIVHLWHRGFLEQAQRARHDHGWGHYGERLRIVAEGGDPGPDTMGQA
jgi:uncharacterized protein YndB with AHSA1/START domain